MKIRPNREMKTLLMELLRAEALMRQEQWNEARELLTRARGYARAQGWPYARIAWSLCVCLDSLGQVEEALRMVVEAIDQDPLATDYRSSFFVVAERLRDLVEKAEEGDPATPARYAMLVEHDAAEAETHVAMARHLLAAGDEPAAAELLEAVTTVAPSCSAAWLLRGELARKQGLTEEADRCGGEALMIALSIKASVRTRGDEQSTHAAPGTSGARHLA